MAGGSGSPRETVRDVLRGLRRDLRVELLTWLAIGIFAGAVSGIGGRYSWDEAPWIGVLIVCLAIPLGPLIWISPLGRGSDLLFRPGGRRIFGVFAAWALLSFLPTVVLMEGVTRLGGID